MKRPLGMALLLACVAITATAQTRVSPNTWKLDGDPPRASIADVAWIAGEWEGDLFGGFAEEAWMAPSGGSMVGMFRLSMQGQPSLYELLSIRETDGTLVLDLKHFNRDLTGWEEQNEKLTFRLVSTTEDEARFEEMTYRRRSDDAIEVYFIQEGPDGKRTEHVFRARRQGSTPPVDAVK